MRCLFCVFRIHENEREDQEMTLKNIFITGQKGVGKSTLLKQWVYTNQKEEHLCGFLTLPIDDGALGSFYMHSLLPVEDNDRLIGRRNSSTSCIPYTDTFETLGVSILKQCIVCEKPIVLLDELGVLERDAINFQESVREVLNTTKIVIGVLKKQNDSFLEEITRRSDTLILELKEDNHHEICKRLKEVKI